MTSVSMNCLKAGKDVEAGMRASESTARRQLRSMSSLRSTSCLTAPQHSAAQHAEQG
jgi:hypothetical protein